MGAHSRERDAVCHVGRLDRRTRAVGHVHTPGLPRALGRRCASIQVSMPRRRVRRGGTGCRGSATASAERAGSAHQRRRRRRGAVVRDWLDARTGYRAGLSHILNEPLPSGTSWSFTLGSVLIFLIVVQAITGIGLALYYAPTPDHAYASVQFIMRDVALGWLVRGLHYFGASAMVIVAAAHVLRVIAFGSYKAPREATWLTGVVLLAVVLGFALTGYLLPW